MPVSKITDNFNNELRDAQSSLIKLADALYEVQRILRQRNLRWNSRQQVSRSLKYQLCLRHRWLIIRKLFLQAHRDAVCLNNAYERMHTAEGTISAAYHDSKTKATSFRVNIGSERARDELQRQVDRFDDLRHQVDQFWEQSLDMLSLPDYMKIKKFLPLGGRNAYSVLIVCREGYPLDTKRNERQLFGWCCDPRLSYMELDHRIKDAIHAIQPDKSERHGTKEKRVPAPSFAQGQRFFRDFPRYDSPPPRRQYFATKMREQLREVLFGGNIESHSLYNATLLNWVNREHHRDGLRKWRIYRRLAEKVVRGASTERDFNYGNSVCTIVTGPPVHVRGQDYYVPAMWPDEGRNLNIMPANTRTTKFVTQGYLLLRAGWPDAIHVSRLPTRQVLEYGVAEGEPVIDGEAITARLDQSSRYYFTSRQSAAERQKTTNQRIAAVLRGLRQLPGLSRADSYSVGNCVPGTKQFIDQLKLDPEGRYPTPDDGVGGRSLELKQVSGNFLAKRWREQKYPQLDRLAPVVERLVKERQAMLAEREQQQARLDSLAVERYEGEGGYEREPQSATTIMLTASPEHGALLSSMNSIL